MVYRYRGGYAFVRDAEHVANAKNVERDVEVVPKYVTGTKEVDEVRTPNALWELRHVERPARRLHS